MDESSSALKYFNSNKICEGSKVFDEELYISFAKPWARMDLITFACANKWKFYKTDDEVLSALLLFYLKKIASFPQKVIDGRIIIYISYSSLLVWFLITPPNLTDDVAYFMF